MTCGICKYFTIWLKISYHIYRTYGRGELSDKKELEATWEKSDKCPVVNDKIYKVIGSWHNDKDIFNRNSKMIIWARKNVYYVKPLRRLDCCLWCCSILMYHICLFSSGQFSLFQQVRIVWSFCNMILAVTRMFLFLLHFLLGCCWF